MVVQSAWASERMGRSLWTAKWQTTSPTDLPGHFGTSIPGDCAPFRGHLNNQDGDRGGYRSGCTILLYLIDQRRRAGADPSTLLRAIRNRAGNGTTEIGRLWKYLGGDDRSAGTLQGELLLSLYADDLIPGISDRLKLGSLDWTTQRAQGGLAFPSQTINAVTSADITFPLWRPDGSVVELLVPSQGAIVQILNPVGNSGIAAVKR